MTTLQELLGEGPADPRSPDTFLARYGLARNPFPSARTIIPELIYNQEVALAKFAARFKETLGPEPRRAALGIVAGTGGGKTHFLRHCQHLISGYASPRAKRIVTVEIQASASSVSQVVREILRRTDQACRDSGEYDLLTAIVRKVETDDELGAIRQSDLRTVLHLLVKATRSDFVPPDKAGLYKFDPLKELVNRWLAGGSLTATERKYLGVFGRLSTASLMTRVVSELLHLARERGVVDGVVLCVDELEALFQSGVSVGKIQSFLQDLRYLFDEAVHGDVGYTLLVLSGSTPTGSTSLRDYNYPLFQRLGFEGDTRADLEPISGFQEAKDFARTYLAHEAAQAATLLPRKVGLSTTYGLLTDQEIEQAYHDAAEVARGQTRTATGRVNQAQLLEALHAAVERKSRQGSSKG